MVGEFMKIRQLGIDTQDVGNKIRKMVLGDRKLLPIFTKVTL
jgi:hypothetical protein